MLGVVGEAHADAVEQPQVDCGFARRSAIRAHGRKNFLHLGWPSACYEVSMDVPYTGVG